MSGGRHRVHHLGASEPIPIGRARRTDPDEVMTSSISTAVVRLLRELTGRGPAKATTVLTSELAVVTLRDCLTTAEKTLAEEGHRGLVIEVRAVLQEELRLRARTVVEEITGRPVIGCLTDQQYDPDMAIVAFVFASA